MRIRDVCEYQTVAESEHCRVDRCSHGTIHLITGGVTLRLAPWQLLELAETIDSAVRRISGRRDAIGSGRAQRPH